MRALPGWGAADEDEYRRRAAEHLAVELVRSGVVRSASAAAGR